MKVIVYSLFLVGLFANISAVSISTTKRKYIGREIEILEDKTRKLSFTDVSSEKYKNNFKQGKRSILRYGLSDSAFWSRFRIENKTKTNQQYLLEVDFTFNESDLYLVDKNNNVYKESQGIKNLPAKREISFRRDVFVIQLNSKESKTIYLRNTGSIGINIALLVWQSADFIRKSNIEVLLYSLYYGILLVMIFYNLFLFISIRDFAYLIYISYISCFGITLLLINRFGQLFIWSGTASSLDFVQFFLSLSFCGAMLFTINFLQTKRNTPIVNKVLITLIVIEFFIAIFSLISDSTFYLSTKFRGLIDTPAIIGIITASIITVKKGYKPAMPFLLAFILYTAGVSLGLLTNSGIFDIEYIFGYQIHYFIVFAIYIGSSLETILLSLALAARFNLLRDQKKQIEVELGRIKVEGLKRIIQPHYLLNSIHAIAGYMSLDPTRASSLVESLGNEFRAILNYSNQKLIPLKEELSLCLSHLDLMSARNLNKYILKSENIDENETIPPLIFHTLIENGIKHENKNSDEITLFLIEQILEKNKITYRILCKQDHAKINSSNISEGTGTKYIKMRLEEAYPSKWNFEQGFTSKGWQSTIVIYR